MIVLETVGSTICLVRGLSLAQVIGEQVFEFVGAVPEATRTYSRVGDTPGITRAKIVAKASCYAIATESIVGSPLWPEQHGPQAGPAQAAERPEAAGPAPDAEDEDEDGENEGEDEENDEESESPAAPRQAEAATWARTEETTALVASIIKSMMASEYPFTIALSCGPIHAREDVRCDEYFHEDSDGEGYTEEQLLLRDGELPPTFERMSELYHKQRDQELKQAQAVVDIFLKTPTRF